jgi:1-acyl-sn-glycerol-3-phosphate acyltransferase
LNPYYWFCYNLIRLGGRIFFRVRVFNRDRMINRGPVIIAANHASYLDPPFVGIVSDRAIFFLARKTLLDGAFFGWLLPKLNVVPVDQEGNDRSALKALIRILKKGEGVLVFPEGERHSHRWCRFASLEPTMPGLAGAKYAFGRLRSSWASRCISLPLILNQAVRKFTRG